MSFNHERHQYPSGAWYILMMVGKEVIGHASEVDGGFLATGRRKLVKH